MITLDFSTNQISESLKQKTSVSEEALGFWKKRQFGIGGSEYAELIKYDSKKSVWESKEGMQGYKTFIAKQASQRGVTVEHLAKTRAIHAKSIEHGNKYESEAIEKIEKLFGITIETENLTFKHPELATASSPDGLVKKDSEFYRFFCEKFGFDINSDTVIEVKCPITEEIHFENFDTLEVPLTYVPQTQGYFLNNPELKNVLFASYSPYVLDKNQSFAFIPVARDMKIITLLYNEIRKADKLINNIISKRKTVAEQMAKKYGYEQT